ncbi:MAG: hypothetical protein HY370_02035 [Proteobacteria bacterium]|nr:hypothetical protein [Pseudomonadota bacterium]
MKKSLTIAALAFTTALASGAAVAQDGVYNVNAPTSDKKCVSTSILVNMSHRSRSEVQSALNAMFASVTARHSAAEFEDASMRYADRNGEGLAQDMKEELARLDHSLGIIVHSPQLPARTTAGCSLK